MMRSRSRRQPGGFTLIEVLLVLTILVILASFAVVQFTGVQRGAKLQAAQTQVGLIETAIQTYEASVNSYPSNLQALRVQPADLPDPTKWAGPYLYHDIPLDPWGHPYQYACPGRHNPDSFDVWSLGPDGADGTPDDIGNWTKEATR
ncbi:MAG: type II secretion system major pseudopilin GspG [Thermoguttaceae bacterium]